MKRAKGLNGWLVLVLCLAVGLWAWTGAASAAPMVLKVSHQFAAGDVRDQMGRVFGSVWKACTSG